eukprot:CAMPEP_0172507284 /NCGR_PEP_ID=MMETSP1066-20121228/202752_1 /TAXON_ID=671091 /ORGANISM="Coscinodiscus wailesii, Strain CCMP2513" /LENGTH=263 /DNA_ID=CAMNT_0013284785 /DNA_START=117 /DNA_END=908 /DNA_ORIENTATION=+
MVHNNLLLLLLPFAAAFHIPPRTATFSPSQRQSRTTTHLSLTPVDSSLLESLSSLSVADAAAPAVGEVTYSKASYYTTLALYVASFPGLWSQIKRSTKAKIKQKTFVSAGEAAENGKDLRQQAGEIMAYMKANNYEVKDAGETITFEGLVARSTSQAFFLTFCTALGLASLALVLQIQFQNITLPLIGTPNWFYMVLLSPYAGLYYWRSGDRVDDIKVRLLSSDDDTENEIIIEGNDEEIDRMWRALELNEKGMVKVEGIIAS